MIEKVLVGIDGSERGARAQAWAVNFANHESAAVTLMLVIDARFTRNSGMPSEQIRAVAEEVLAEAKEQAQQQCPSVPVEVKLVEGRLLEAIADEAEGYDLVVLGSHHGGSVGESIGGAKGLRIAVSTTTPTAVIPVDWSEKFSGRGIVVGLAPDDSSDSAVAFALEMARETKEPLELVSTWGLPAFLSKPAKAMGGELTDIGRQYQQRIDALVAQLKEANPDIEISGQAVEGESPTRALIDYSKGFGTLVLGTRTTSALGRALFGSLTHSVLMNLTIPTIVVSQP